MTRPKQRPESHRVIGTISKDEYEALLRLSRKQDRSISWLVREAIRTYLARQEAPRGDSDD